MTLCKPDLEHTLDAIGSSLISTYNLKTLKDTKEILFYSKEGVYRLGGEEIVEQTVRTQIDRNISRHDLNEILYYIQTSTYTDRADFDKDINILNVRNGLLNIETGEFLPHNPAYLSMTQLPVTYDLKATCPNIMKFLTTTLDSAQLRVVVRLFGYLLLRSARYEKAFMLNGEGGNGKSVFIKLLVALVGKDKTSNVSLQELTTDRFASSKLYGKMLNVFADLRSDRITDSGYFKVLVSGDRIMAQRKHQEPFEFENTAKLVFSANQIPETDDKSHAYFRRWVIIPFNRTFEGVARDEQLIDKLTTENELSGLLNVALVGLKRLKEERGFDDTDLDEIRRQYELGATKIQGFFDECCILDPENEDLQIMTLDLQEALAKYCEQKGSKYVDIRQFGEKLKALGVRRERKRKGAERPYFYFGIALKPNCPYVPNKSLTTGYNGNYTRKEGCLSIGTQDQQTLGGVSA